MNSDEIYRDLMSDPATHDWLRKALVALLHKDPVDAANDAMMLSQWAAQRCADGKDFAKAMRAASLNDPVEERRVSDAEA